MLFLFLSIGILSILFPSFTVFYYKYYKLKIGDDFLDESGKLPFDGLNSQNSLDEQNFGLAKFSPFLSEKNIKRFDKYLPKLAFSRQGDNETLSVHVYKEFPLTACENRRKFNLKVNDDNLEIAKSPIETNELPDYSEHKTTQSLIASANGTESMHLIEPLTGKNSEIPKNSEVDSQKENLNVVEIREKGDENRYEKEKIEGASKKIALKVGEDERDRRNLKVVDIDAKKIEEDRQCEGKTKNLKEKDDRLDKLGKLSEEDDNFKNESNELSDKTKNIEGTPNYSGHYIKGTVTSRHLDSVPCDLTEFKLEKISEAKNNISEQTSKVKNEFDKDIKNASIILDESQTKDETFSTENLIEEQRKEELIKTSVEEETIVNRKVEADKRHEEKQKLAAAKEKLDESEKLYKEITKYKKENDELTEDIKRL